MKYEFRGPNSAIDRSDAFVLPAFSEAISGPPMGVVKQYFFWGLLPTVRDQLSW